MSFQDIKQGLKDAYEQAGRNRQGNNVTGITGGAVMWRDSRVGRNV